MHVSKLLAVAVMASSMAAPAFAAPNPAASGAPLATNPATLLSLANAGGVKRSSTLKRGSRLIGAPLVLLVLAGAGAAGGIAVAATSGRSDSN